MGRNSRRLDHANGAEGRVAPAAGLNRRRERRAVRRPLAVARIVACPSLLLAAACAGAQTTPAVERVAPIRVIGVTPLEGTGLPLDIAPSNVQIADDKDLDPARTLSLPDFMNRALTGVNVNAAQSNPLQPDVQYRGFTASPLLGLPQGLSVYQDGVRLNEPFGDTVNWDVIPQSAVASMNLMPGSNPLFGRNTLGGAISLRTKDGFRHSGVRSVLYGGSFGRKYAQAEYGGVKDNVGLFLTGEYFDEDGWRDYSPSNAKRAFGKLSLEGEDGFLNATLTHAETDLIGNGPLPEQLLAIDREAIFTRPDITENELLMLGLNGERYLSDNVSVDANLHYRRNDIDTLNGDDSDAEACEDPANAGLLCRQEDDGEEVIEDQFGNPVAAGEAVEGATTNTSRTENESYGGTLQFTFSQDLAGRENQFIVGASAEWAESKFRSQTELGTLDATRLAVGSGVFDGESFVAVNTDVDTYSLFFTDTWRVTPKLALTAAGRWNRIEVKLDDQIGTALNGDHTFTRFNPALGAAYEWRPELTLFGSYAESNRAPTPVELTCADEDDPCRLPNAFLADPPLDDVVAKTFEAGVRGHTATMGYTLSLFHTVNEDDIIFISAGGLSSEGFFDNVGDTRRRGLELALDGSARPFGGAHVVNWFLSYTFLEAEFRENLAIASANHPLADANGVIFVSKGDRIPGLPQHMLKLGADTEVLPNLSVGFDLVYNSDQVLRGDESNQLAEVDDYAVVNLNAEYQVRPNFSVFVNVENLFDQEYETFGVVGEADEVLGPAFDSPRFLSPGPERGVWAGVRLAF